MQNETVIVLDFGGQYNQLIARRVTVSVTYIARLCHTKILSRRLKKKTR